MKSAQLNQLKAEEERKRASAYDPAQRWQHIQQTITWAEANLPRHLRRNRPRTRGPEERRTEGQAAGGWQAEPS
jgi:hypothetical protein